MTTSLETKLENIISTSTWSFNVLPEKMVHDFDELVAVYPKEALMDGLSSLTEKYREIELKSRGGTSGIAGEYHMAMAMRLHYARKGLKYISEC